MAVKSDLIAGTITLTSGSTAFTGTGTSFALAGVQEGDEFKQIAGQTQWEAMVETITDNTHGTLVRPWGGSTGTYAYRLRFQADGQRVTAQARNLIELLGDGTLLSLAGLSGPGVIELLAGGGAQVVPKTDLISGAAYDVQVANLTARAAYDGQATGYSVLVSDVGDGRAAIYSKNSASTADWSAPAYVTGPVGPASTIPGITWRGTYSGATAYVVNDGVKFNGSSFRNIVAGTGNAPSSAAPPVDNTWWVVVAAKGTDGAGTGDVVGPATSVADRVAVFNGTTGKLVKDGGKTIAEIMALPTRYWQGYQHSPNVSTPNTKIDIASGSCRDSTDAINIANSSGTMDLTTTGANGLDAGSLAAGTWYYTFAITTAAGVTAFLASLSPTAPTLPSGYTKFRRIGSFLVDGSVHILPFFHLNDTWYWMTARRDISTGATVGTSFVVSSSLSVPRIFGLTALGAATFFAASGAINFYIAPTSVTDTVGDGFAHNVGATGGTIPTRVMVDASAKIKYRSNAASSTFVFDTAGWIDPL